MTDETRTWTCVRCGTTVEPFAFTVSEDDDLLPDLTEEAEAWVWAYDRKSGRLCPDCATQAEKWQDEDRCVRCGAEEPWPEFFDDPDSDYRRWADGDFEGEPPAQYDEWQERAEWLRVSADGSVCPDCWVPADAEAEGEAMATLGPIIGRFGLRWDDSTIERNEESQHQLNRLRDADGPEALLEDGA